MIKGRRWRQAEDLYSLIRCRRRRHLPDKHPHPLRMKVFMKKLSLQKITTLKTRHLLAGQVCAGGRPTPTPFSSIYPRRTYHYE